MKRFVLLAILLIVCPLSRARSDAQSFQQADAGRYLATVGDYVACHTAPGGKPFSGGRKIATPFGLLVSPNITPDRETGIGAWTDDQFLHAMWDGIGPQGEHFYPAFPYPWFTKMTRDDVLGIRRYLETLDPVSNAVKTNQLPFPFDIRSVMIGWNALYFKAKRFNPVAGKSDEWNRGAYLVEGPGHCGACHTAKNVLGGDENSKALEGGKLDGWFAPDLTADRRGGLGTWTVDQIVEYLHTGRAKSAAATGPMAEVISLSTSHFTATDLRAIAIYLKDLPTGHEDATPVAPPQPVMTAGRSVFEAQCQACHRSDGAGVTGLFPALAKASDVQSADPTDLLRVVLRGGKSVATQPKPTGAAMPPFGWKLSDQQIADVLTYIRNDWGNAAAAVSSGDVASARHSLAQAKE